MVYWEMIKILFAAALTISPLMAEEKLEDFRWKKRLLVVTQESKPVAEKIAGARDELVERDVQVFFLKPEKPVSALEKELRERLKVNDEVAEVLLLGKDGRTTLRWKMEDFEIADLLRKIDSMPMRQKESQANR
jgi:hypothetical protein